MKRGFVFIILLGTMIFSLAGCQSEPDKQQEHPAATSLPEQNKEKFDKQLLELPNDYDKTEFYIGGFTRSQDGRLEFFLRTIEEGEESRIVYYDLNEENEWVRKELKNKAINKILNNQDKTKKSRVQFFKRGDDGNLYCICETVKIEDDPYVGFEAGETKAYLVCLGADGSKFQKHRLMYSNSGGRYEDGSYVPIDSYDVLEDGRALIRYADNHCELYSLEKEEVVKSFSDKTSKYGLWGIDDDIFRVGEDWLGIQVIDEESEETVRTYEHNFKRLSGQGTFLMDGCGDDVYLLDGRGLHYLERQRDGTFETVEATNRENSFDKRCAIQAFGADEYGNVYIFYEVNRDGKGVDGEWERTFAKYSVR